MRTGVLGFLGMPTANPRQQDTRVNGAPDFVGDTQQVTHCDPPTTRQWLKKDEAAKLLGLSPQRVLAMSGKGKPIKSKLERDPVSNQVVKLLHAGDVAQVLWHREHPNEKPETAEAAELPDKPQLALPAPETADTAQKDSMAETRPPNWDPHCWPCWLPLPEAAEYSGCTKRWLIEQADATILTPDFRESNIAIRDMGKHSPGGRWRFHRE